MIFLSEQRAGFIDCERTINEAVNTTMNSSVEADLIIEGSCYCGAINFSCAGPPKWCGHCHCTICQKVHGSGVVTWVGFDTASVTVTDPDKRLKWFESTPGAQRGRCDHCGSNLFFRSVKWPGELHVTRASLSPEVTLVPDGHAFYDTHVDWLKLADKPNGE